MSPSRGWVRQAAKKLPMVSRASAARRWWVGTSGVCQARSRLRLAFAELVPHLVGEILSISLRASDPPIFLRTASSDRSVFWQVFVCNQYDLDYGLGDPRLIVDAGANIGLASVFFACRHPAARIVALEPDNENFAILSQNVRDFKNIQAIKAALWHERTTVEIHDPGVGAWALRVDTPSSEYQIGAVPNHPELRGLAETTTVQELIDANGGRIDLLKLDIEGSEWNVLVHADDWIEQVGTVVAELHLDVHPDCRDVFDAATSGFRDHQTIGELVLARR